MTNDEKIAIITSFQDNPLVHSLTCSVNSLHENLVPKVYIDEVMLVCPTCKTVQLIDDEFIRLLGELDTRQREFGRSREALMKQHRCVKEF